MLSVAPFPASDSGCWLSTAADAVVAKHRIALSSVLDSGQASEPVEEVPRSAMELPDAAPEKVVRTGHAGQQGARVRDDGRVCATAGWDGRVRVYAGTGLREVAVLKWHKEGCYTVDFASLVRSKGGEQPGGDSLQLPEEGASSEIRGRYPDDDGSGMEARGESLRLEGEVEAVVRSGPTLVARRREERVRSTHWLAAGAKDGKVSLWNIL